jgi:hypothetical protein
LALVGGEFDDHGVAPVFFDQKIGRNRAPGLTTLKLAGADLQLAFFRRR